MYFQHGARHVQLNAHVVHFVNEIVDLNDLVSWFINLSVKCMA